MVEPIVALSIVVFAPISTSSSNNHITYLANFAVSAIGS